MRYRCSGLGGHDFGGVAEMSCTGNCKHSKCPTPYTCGIHEFGKDPMPIDMVDSEADAKPLPAPAWFFAGVAIGAALVWGIHLVF